MFTFHYSRSVWSLWKWWSGGFAQEPQIIAGSIICGQMFLIKKRYICNVNFITRAVRTVPGKLLRTPKTTAPPDSPPLLLGPTEKSPPLLLSSRPGAPFNSPRRRSGCPGASPFVNQSEMFARTVNTDVWAKHASIPHHTHHIYIYIYLFIFRKIIRFRMLDTTQTWLLRVHDFINMEERKRDSKWDSKICQGAEDAPTAQNVPLTLRI